MFGKAMLAAAIAAAAAPGLAADVTSQRLQNPAAEPQNWLMVHHDYDNSRHSALKAINRDTVKNLQLKFMFSIGGRSTGGTMRACRDLVQSTGAEVVACAFLIELSFLGGRAKLVPSETFSLVTY